MGQGVGVDIVSRDTHTQCNSYVPYHKLPVAQWHPNISPCSVLQIKTAQAGLREKMTLKWSPVQTVCGIQMELSVICHVSDPSISSSILLFSLLLGLIIRNLEIPHHSCCLMACSTKWFLLPRICCIATVKIKCTKSQRPWSEGSPVKRH